MKNVCINILNWKKYYANKNIVNLKKQVQKKYT